MLKLCFAFLEPFLSVSTISIRNETLLKSTLLSLIWVQSAFLCRAYPNSFCWKPRFLICKVCQLLPLGEQSKLCCAPRTKPFWKHRKDFLCCRTRGFLRCFGILNRSSLSFFLAMHSSGEILIIQFVEEDAEGFLTSRTTFSNKLWLMCFLRPIVQETTS